MTYELVELTRLGKSAAELPASQHALSSEEDKDRGHDRQVREQRVDVAEDAFAFALRDDVGDTREHGVHHVKRRGVEMWRACRLDLEGMITARRPLAEVNEAMADMTAGVGLRTVLTI